MRISTSPPPVMDRILFHFNVTFESGVAITYGDTVHVKSGKLSQDLAIHEMTHIEQQRQMGADAWWDAYFDNPQFRLDQELQAYTNQTQWIKHNVKDRNRRAVLFHHIWSSMANLYGNMITYQQAQKLIPA